MKISNVSFSYGEQRVVDDVSLTIRSGEILSIVGPSGCGKSTFLRLIAGLEKPSSGTLVYGDQIHSSMRFLFQDYDAFPWFTVQQNVALDGNNVEEAIRAVGLWDSRHKYPAELSSGMRKRLALARIIVAKPALLLLDEPFSSLDIDTRSEMHTMVYRQWEENHQTILLVTHDLHEAIILSSQVLVSTPRPFQIADMISIPYPYPRSDDVVSTSDYPKLMNQMRQALRQSH